MSSVARDDFVRHANTAPRGGLLYAVVSAATFGLSGSLGRGLIDAGWSPAAAVCMRVLIAAAVLLVPTIRSLRGRWALALESAPLVVAYGVVAVAGCQFAYFNAVSHMPVAVALLIEYVSPIVVLVWMWLRHAQRPGRHTVAGAVVALAGLPFVLDLFSAARVSPVGMAWAFAAMFAVATYFILSATDSELPPLALAGLGLLVGGLALAGLGALGAIDFRMTVANVDFAGNVVAWWIPLLALGVVTAAIAYVTGIAAGRRLGSRLASFVALLEVLFAMLYAVWLLGERPTLVQLAGGGVMLAGVVLVKLGEPDGAAPLAESPSSEALTLPK